MSTPEETTVSNPSPDVALVADHDHRRHIVGGQPMVFHCHHYNTFLQRSIQDATYIDSQPFLVGAAAEVGFTQFTSDRAGSPSTAPEARLAYAAQLYRWAGFGVVDLSGLTPDGGEVVATSSHYGSAWKAKFGPSDEPVDYFTQGWLAGVAAAAFGLGLGSFRVDQDQCLATGSEQARFRLSRGPANYEARPSVGVGPLTDHDIEPVAEHNVDYEGIYRALVGMPIEGDDEGLIPAFGVYLTHHYANYYNRVSFEFERAMVDKFGQTGVEAARPLLVEAGHVCAFNTFGGIMQSTEWDALIRPSLRTPEDWVHGIVAAVNALGWGRWQVTDVNRQAATFVIHDDYESVGHLAMYGQSDHPISYLAEGAVLGIMNLVYRGNIADRPELTPEFYDHLFRDAESYQAVAKTSQAMGDETTVFQVNAPA